MTFADREYAQSAVTSLDGYMCGVYGLKVDISERSSIGRRTARFSKASQNTRFSDVPLRILVPNEYIGAIIGRSGATIRNITQQTNAKVDIHRRINTLSDTVVIIKGGPAVCSRACKEIIDVVRTEAASLNKGECSLRILCPNNLCGRIIGKKGNVTKSFMERSNIKMLDSMADTNETI